MLRSEINKICNELADVIDHRKPLENRESEIKKVIRDLGKVYIDTGKVVVTIDECVRQGINIPQMLADLGEKFVNKYKTETTFKQIRVIRKRAA